uniref:hypothetical protein n=1 Tax=Dictyotopsis propagulifera TaxID=670095 RepID=UPI002E75AF21|nr:hypothetical protein V2485_pgp014 [Dictyotopsis propagulifera]WAM63243.1 hypothetical protein [Dictyotopsis propagulifera]
MWHNLLRYPRFFISSLLGLLLVLLMPITKILNDNPKKWTIFVVLLILSFILLLAILTLRTMLLSE